MRPSKQQSPKSLNCQKASGDIGKSVAQRVMEVAANANGQQLADQGQSLESDQEVEDITNRAAKLDVGLSSVQHIKQQTDQQTVAGDYNNNSSNNHTSSMNSVTSSNTTRLTIKRSSDSSSLSLLMDNSTPPPPSGPDNCRPSALGSSNLLDSGESVFEQVVASTKSHREGSSKSGSQNSVDLDISRISLDTKVPHPSKGQFCPPEEFGEEVSYYNDQVKPTNSSEILNQTNSKQWQQQATSRPKSLAAKGHTLSVIVPNICASRNNIVCPQAEYSNDLMADESEIEQLDEDDYDTRYDNAEVEKNIRQMSRKHEQHPRSSGVMSTPTSPKAKSAPATPCNVTPTAFHQHTSHLNAMLNPSPANTLPPDIRKNISATCRVLPSAMGAQPGRLRHQHSLHQLHPAHQLQQDVISSAYLDELFKRAERSLEAKDYDNALHLYSRCIELAKSGQKYAYLSKNFEIYIQRAKAYFQLAQYSEAIEDSMAARGINPQCTEAYYLQGQAQFKNGQQQDALAVFAYGLTRDPSEKSLFEALVETAIKSISDFEAKYSKLRSYDLEKKPFVVVSVVGQELLEKGHAKHAAVILESALKLGADDKRLKSSVWSSISYAYCAIGNYEKAVSSMEEELKLEEDLSDAVGQCRVLSNLGYTYYKIHKLDESLGAHRKQLTLAMRAHLFQQAAMALNAIGHVHAARNHYDKALTSHSRCLEILIKLDENDFHQCRELLAIGYMHSMMADYSAAKDKYNEAIELLRTSRKMSADEKQIGLVMVKFNLAYLALKRQCYSEAEQYYSEVIQLSKSIGQPRSGLYHMRALNGLGQTNRLAKRFEQARSYFCEQLRLADSLNDQRGRSQALGNLGLT